MTGRVIIVTGANSGLGFETSKYLCDAGNDVILACRSEEKGKAAVGKILKANPNALATFMQLDLADLASVRQFVEEFRQSGRSLHVLVNNAGLFLAVKDPKRYFTKDNFELAMGTNHIGHFLLTHLLLDDLKKTGTETGDSRIVVVSSSRHDGNFRNKTLPALDLDDIFLGEASKYNANLGYKNSKLANLLFTYELAKKLDGTGITINALCPGFIPSTELVRHASAPTKFYTRYLLDGVLRFTKQTHSTAHAAKDIVQLVTDEKLKGVNGKFYRDQTEVESSAESRDEELAKKLWDLTARYCHLEGYEPLDAPPPPVEEPKAADTPSKSKDKKKSKKEEETDVKAEDGTKIEAEGQTEAKAEGEEQAEVRTEGEGQAEVKVEVEAPVGGDKEVTGSGDDPKKDITPAPVIELEPETKGKDIMTEGVAESAVTAQ